MSNWLLIIFVTLTPGQPAQVWKVSGNYDYQTCRGKIAPLVQEALQVYPAAAVTGQCFQMVPA